jgi:hypothetical protein
VSGFSRTFSVVTRRRRMPAGGRGGHACRRASEG